MNETTAGNVDRALVLTYRLKIAATVLAWCLPLLFVGRSQLQALGLDPDPSMMPLRMLGWAYVALCVGYTAGLRAALAGRVETGPIDVGIVSNGGAALMLAGHGALGLWDTWHPMLGFHLWGSALVAGGIAAALVAARLRQRPARRAIA